MSCFEGRMKEYRQISIDRFDKDNLQSTVFFLSHCHRDHMVGLKSQGFLRHLKKHDDIFLYCSEVTKILLLSENIYKPLEKFVRVLAVGTATTVTVPDPAHPEAQTYKSVMVTALPAGHCPGSVMLLFEGHDGTALYTGDFRWEKNYATTLPALCVNGHMKDIDSMYVDTTFCMPEAFHIPSRDQCLSATTSLIVPWLEKSPCHYVHISSKTRYGHEPLLAHLAKEANTQIHVENAKVQIYEQIAELKGFFTTDRSARIHACIREGSREALSPLPCGYQPSQPHNDSSAPSSSTPLSVLVIRPSTMWFTAEPSRLQELVASPNSVKGVHRVCFSFHSSYSEVRDLVSLLHPRHVFPNVLPPSDSTWEPVTARLRSFLTFPHKQHQIRAEEITRPLGLLKRKRRVSSLSQNDLDGLVFDSQEKISEPQDVSREVNPDLPCQDGNKLVTNSSEKNSQSDLQSSYQGSCPDEDLFDSDSQSTVVSDKCKSSVCIDENGENATKRNNGDPEESVDRRSYVSGDEEMPEEDRLSPTKFQHISSQDDTEKDIIGPSPEIVSRSKHPLLERSSACSKRLKLEDSDETGECEQFLKGKSLSVKQTGVASSLEESSSFENSSKGSGNCQELLTRSSRESQNRNSCSVADLGPSTNSTSWAVMHIPEKTRGDEVSPKAETKVSLVDLQNHTEEVQDDKKYVHRDSSTNTQDWKPKAKGVPEEKNSFLAPVPSSTGVHEEKTTAVATVPFSTEEHQRSSAVAACLPATVTNDLAMTVHHDTPAENNLVLTIEDAQSPAVESGRNAFTSPDTLSTESEMSAKHAGSKIETEVSEGFSFGKQASSGGIGNRSTNIQSGSPEKGAPEMPTQCVELVLSSSNSPCEVNDLEKSQSPIIFPLSVRSGSDFKNVGKKALGSEIFNVDENLHDADVEDNVDEELPRQKTKLNITDHDDDIHEVIVIDDHDSLDSGVRCTSKYQCSKGNFNKVKHLPRKHFPSLLTCTKTISKSPKQIIRQSQVNCRTRGHSVQAKHHQMSKSKQNGNSGSVAEGDNSIQMDSCSDSDATLPPESPIAIVDSDSNSGLVVAATVSCSKCSTTKAISTNSQQPFFIDLTEDDG